MRNRVAFKIFSIALCLVVVLVVVAALSSRNISRVRDELVATAEYYIPLEQASSRVTFLELEQDAIHQRILLLYAGARDRAAIEEQKQLFEARGQKVDEEVLAVTRLIEQGLQQATDQDERLEFTRPRWPKCGVVSSRDCGPTGSAPGTRPPTNSKLA